MADVESTEIRRISEVIAGWTGLVREGDDCEEDKDGFLLESHVLKFK